MSHEFRDGRYVARRRAYFPSLWSLWLLAIVAMQPAAWLASGWWRPVLEVASALTVAWLRIQLWRWRHPVITHGQYLDDLREKAPWN